MPKTDDRREWNCRYVAELGSKLLLSIGDFLVLILTSEDGWKTRGGKSEVREEARGARASSRLSGSLLQWPGSRAAINTR